MMMVRRVVGDDTALSAAGAIQDEEGEEDYPPDRILVVLVIRSGMRFGGRMARGRAAGVAERYRSKDTL